MSQRPARTRNALVLFAGCATVPVTLPTEPMWGYIADSRTSPERREIVATDRTTCEIVRAKDAKTHVVPPECRPLVISPGADAWIVRAVYLPAGSFIGANTREGCEALEKWQARDTAISTRVCQPASVRLLT